MNGPTHDAEHLLRDLAPQVLGAVARRHTDFAEAEDAVQDALIAAAQQWPRSGVPDNPAGWLYRVARRRLADIARSDSARRERELSVSSEMPSEVMHASETPDSSADDSLILLFMCCHPSLSHASAIALTLRAVGGLSTSEIANAFLVPEATMAQRISRAKLSIRSSNVSFSMPDTVDVTQRISAVMHVLYLIFNEGYSTSDGQELMRVDLADEAIRLTRMLYAQLPDSGGVAGLLGLMLLTHSRRDARSGPHGELIPLDEQNRELWKRDEIREGRHLASRGMSAELIGEYQIQAAIAAIHSAAHSVEATDWAAIAALYDALGQITGNPFAILNRAIAVAMTEGPSAGLALIEPLTNDARVAGHYRLSAVRAHLLERAGDLTGAVELYRTAAGQTHSAPERDYLRIKAAALAMR